MPAIAADHETSIVGRMLSDGEAEVLRATPTGELGLSVRATNVAGRLGWRTALDAAGAPASATLGVKNCGRKTVAEIRQCVLKTLEAQEDGNRELPTTSEALRHLIDEMVQSLDEKHEFVLRERFGLWDGTRETLEDLGYTLGVTRERVRQIERNSALHQNL